ncbi:helix-turn-helix domain-containing protein [Chryseobacterium sp.]|uniref:AraC family transcriptional regulator n=1 Tax=Chryseobacterium sp. TaxID=1871047 RepID=UPI0025C301F2|nr:helix-turn-helix domain-containing protein [Chryseobacterium sp.]
MLYKEYQPSALLSPYIETYWTSNSPGNGEFHKVLPDGCVDIIFQFNKTKNIFYAEICGTMTTFLNMNFLESIQIFGIRFRPIGITFFTRVPVEEFTDKNVELALVDTLFDKSFYEILPEKRSVEDMIKHVDNYLINNLPYLYSSEKQIIHAVDLIYLTKGQLSLTTLAADVCLCQRHFERKFKSAIGISPKMFAKISRFKHALWCLKNYSHKDLLTIAIECGYYDHSHLIKDFKSLSGHGPTNLLQ